MSDSDTVSEQMLEGEACCNCLAYIGPATGVTRLCRSCGGAPDYDESLESKEHRARMRAAGFDALADAGYAFDVKNGAAHLIVRTDHGIVDFWPGTGKWITRFNHPGTYRMQGRGADNLMRAFKPSGEAVERPAMPAQTEVLDHYLIAWKPHMSAFALRTYEAAGYTITGKPA